MTSRVITTTIDAIKERPLLAVGISNGVTAMIALYIHAGGIRGIKKFISTLAFQVVVGSARLVAANKVAAEEEKIMESVRSGVVGKIEGARYRVLPKVSIGIVGLSGLVVDYHVFEDEILQFAVIEKHLLLAGGEGRECSRCVNEFCACYGWPRLEKGAGTFCFGIVIVVCTAVLAFVYASDG